MVRRTKSAAWHDERTFAIRLRIAIPEIGLKCSIDLFQWLRERTNDQYGIHGASHGMSLQQCSYIYVNDPAIALECIERFKLQLWALEKQSPSNMPGRQAKFNDEVMRQALEWLKKET